MKSLNFNIGKVFLFSALMVLIIGLVFGLLASVSYILPDFLKDTLGFTSLRPLHVSLVMFWIIIGSVGCVYCGLQQNYTKNMANPLSLLQWFLWVLAICGIIYSYFRKDFGGREYWEFNPIWALPIAIAWLLFIINFIKSVYKISKWPVHMWMWMTGIVFFLFTFIENYLWVFPYFRERVILDMTIQWKVNGSLVGSWNQILYGTAFYLMDRIGNNKAVTRSKLAFAMYFLGLFNLMFNWGHHIYTLPTDAYVRYVGYAVSMTEWIFFISIIYKWKKNITQAQKNYHYYPYRFLMAADFWIFINMGQAIIMSIPALNLYTHGTHVTVAHAMGTTIGINSMILLAACFEFFSGKCRDYKTGSGILRKSFWVCQASLLVFWLTLNIIGIKKGIWQMSSIQIPFNKMMLELQPWFILFVISGFILLIALIIPAFTLMRSCWMCSIWPRIRFSRTVKDIPTDLHIINSQ